MVMSTWHELSTFMHFHVDDEKDETVEEEKKFAGLMRNLTGEYYTKISCDKLQAEDREFYDEVVFLGDEKDLANHNGEMLSLLSQIDRFTYDQQRIGFYWNDEPECKKQFDLEEDKPHLLMLNGLNSIESNIALTGEYHDPYDLMYMINTQVCKGTPRWSQRSNSVIFDHNKPALVLMLEKDAFVDEKTDSRDWRIALMAKITEWVQEYDNIEFLTVIAHQDREDEN